MAKQDKAATPENETITTTSTAGMDGGRKSMSLGVIIMLLGVLISVVISYMAEDDAFSENLIMTVAMFVCLGLAAFGLKTLAIVLTSLQVAGYLAFKIYGLMVNGEILKLYSYLWIVAPVVGMVGIILFASGLEKLKVNNQVLMRQIDELSIIDPLTGLYNLRGLYMDAQTQISYAERKGNAISVMMIKLRYPEEMKTVLKQEQYNLVIKRLATLLCDTVRLEDKVYSVGPDGKFAIILTCDKAGTKIVEKRMRGKIDSPEWLKDISNKPIRGEVKLGYLEYSSEKFHRDISSFIASVEEEVEYDI